MQRVKRARSLRCLLRRERKRERQLVARSMQQSLAMLPEIDSWVYQGTASGWQDAHGHGQVRLVLRTAAVLWVNHKRVKRMGDPAALRRGTCTLQALPCDASSLIFGQFSATPQRFQFLYETLPGRERCNVLGRIYRDEVIKPGYRWTLMCVLCKTNRFSREERARGVQLGGSWRPMSEIS